MSGDNFKAVIGFDGYIDRIERIVRTSRSNDDEEFFETIPEFASRVGAAAGLSADFETVTRAVKLGGNAPIMAEAMSSLGIDTVCIGALGYPDILPEFSKLAEKCDCRSVCDPALTDAFEFGDGKLMFADTGVLEKGLTWDNITSKLGLDELRRIYDGCDLAAFVNWSGVSGMDGIIGGFERDIVPRLSRKKRVFFFDLSDPSKKTGGQINNVLGKISGFSEYGEVMIGLNENEASLVCRALTGRTPEAAEQACLEIYGALYVSSVIVHPTDRSIAVSGDKMIIERGTLVKDPVISTGGGDNFNAGFCLGRLSGMSMSDSLKLGMKVSGYYVSHGYSPSAEILR